MTRVAAVDCGTNSIRLLIADVDPQTATITDVERRMEIVRLGQGVDRTGRIAPEAMARTLDATSRYAQACARAQVSAIRFVATSASRDAENRDEFVAGVRALLGVEPEVVDGEEEAQLSFTGATRELHGRYQAPYLVVDLGGGSTEFVLGGAEPTAALSVNIGCVRIFERHLHSDPPAEHEIAAAVVDIDDALDRVAAEVPLWRARTLVGLAGSVTTVTAHALGLHRYDSAAIHGAVLPAKTVLASCDELLQMSRADRSHLRYMHPGRVDVIGAGALIWARVVLRAGVPEVLTSEHDILDGIALSLVR